MGLIRDALGLGPFSPYWVRFVAEAGLDAGPDERRLPPGQVWQVPTGACRRPGEGRDLRLGGACDGAGDGAGLASQVGTGLAAGRGFAASQVGAELAAGRGLLQPPAKTRVPRPGCRSLHGAVLPVSRGVRTAVPEPGE